MKIYTENGAKYQFDYEQMNVFINMRRHERMNAGEQRVSKEKIKKEIAERLVISPETIKSWMSGTNSPEDAERVKGLAEYLKVDYHELLKTEEVQETKEEDTIMAEEARMMELASKKQAIITRDRVREIYEALVEAIDKAERYFYYELYTYHESNLVKYYTTEYEEAEEACKRVGFLSRKYMLDIPKKIKKAVDTAYWNMAEGIIMDTVCAFTVGGEDEETISDIHDRLQLKKTYYLIDLQKVFSDYILQE